MHNRNDYEAIVQQYDINPEGCCSDSSRRLLCASALLHVGRTPDALRLLNETSLPNMPSELHIDALEVIGDCYTDLSKYSKALSAYKHALELAQSQSKPMTSLQLKALFSSVRTLDKRMCFLLLDWLSDTTDGRHSYLPYVQFEIEQLYANRRCTWDPYLIGLAGFVPDRYFSLVSLVRKTYLLGNLRESLRLAERAVAELPEYFTLWYQLAQIYESLGERYNALESLSRIVARYPNSWRLRYCLALLMWREARYEDAETHLRQALVVYPDSGEAWLLLAATLGRQSKVQEAVACYKSAIPLLRQLGLPFSLREIGYAEGGLVRLEMGRGKFFSGFLLSFCSFIHIFRFVRICKSYIGEIINKLSNDISKNLG